jgi:8-oxo-dGTP pyrophosphatase MutT (NUDIX family)
MSAFEPLGGEAVYTGRIVDVRLESFRHADGEVVTREIVRSKGAVGVLAHDSEQLWLVRQPREAVGERALLEIPAGRLDVEGEAPLEAGKRELAEEVGLAAEVWEPMLSYYSSVGFTDERVHLFRATELRPEHAESGENERIDVVRLPLARLEEAITKCRDAKTLIALMWLDRRLRG